MDKPTAELEAMRLEEPWIIMVHPDLENSYQKVTIDAFDEVWQDVGWEKATDLLDENGEPYSWSAPSEPSPEGEEAPTADAESEQAKAGKEQ